MEETNTPVGDQPVVQAPVVETPEETPEVAPETSEEVHTPTVEELQK